MVVDTSRKIKDFFIAYPLRTFDKRQIIVRAEDMLPGVFYITEGRVSQYDITPSGNEVVVNVFKPGAFFPMSWAMNHTTNYYFFEASTKVVTHVAPAANAVQFLKDNPDVTFDLLGRVYRGVDGVLRRMAHLMGGDAKSRLLFELLNAAYRFGELQEDGSVYVPLKESDLARHSGLARETVNRTLQSLKIAELVNITHSGITIKRIDRVEAMLGAAL
jgi:CRP-like cAMP-binding protein